MENNKETMLDMLIGCQPLNIEHNQFTEDKALDRASELESLGFNKIAQNIMKKLEKVHKLGKTVQYKYIRIAPTKIKEYLKKKADRYDEQHPKKSTKQTQTDNAFTNWMLQAMPFATYSSTNIMQMQEQIRMHMSIDSAGSFSGLTPVTTCQAEKHSIEKFSEPTNDYISRDKNTIGQYIYTEIPIDQYEEVPPPETLRSLKEHQNRHIFDYFTIAKVSHIPDPILFGRIDGCEDRFYVCQWGNDITLDDII